jgi:hypothetical protein
MRGEEVSPQMGSTRADNPDFWVDMPSCWLQIKVSDQNKVISLKR